MTILDLIKKQKEYIRKDNKNRYVLFVEQADLNDEELKCITTNNQTHCWDSNTPEHIQSVNEKKRRLEEERKKRDDEEKKRREQDFKKIQQHLSDQM